MTITEIESVTKDRFRIVLDSGEKFILYKGEIRVLKLKTNMELTDELYSQIMKGILVKRSRLRAMNLLKTKDYTEYQLRRKLVDNEYPKEIVEQAIQYVKSYHYVDDKKFAVEYIKEQYEKHSKKEIYQKLQLKGIDKSVLDAAFYETYGEKSDLDEGTRVKELAIIEKTLRKRGFTGNESYEERQKMLAYFYRRGFEMDAVYSAMDSLSCDYNE